MTDLYIETPTRADYDALMQLAEAAGYKWCSGSKPTEEYKFHRYGCETVIRMRKNMFLEYCDKPYYEDNQGATIETIPNLAKIKAIWKVSRENRDAFTMKHRLPPHYKSARKLYVICDEYSGTYTTKENEIYEALAVEYKPEKSEDIMPKKVKLPRNVIDTFRPALDSPGYRILGSLTPIRIISGMYNRILEGMTSDVAAWLDESENYWKLIDALRYGYEPEPEPRWGIKAGHSYLYEPNDKSFGPDEEPFAYALRERAEEVVARLGFGKVVDLNKVGKADD